MPHRDMVVHIVQKPEARKLGLTRYFTGKPCKFGHIAIRYAAGPCSACVAIRTNEWQKNNPEKVKKAKRDYLDNNREKHYRSTARWQRDNIHKVRQATKEWFARNPEKRRVYVNARRAMERGAPGSFGVTDVFIILLSQGGLCNACKKDVLEEGYHLDHVKPLSKGGSNNPENIQVLCPSCNVSKGSKDYDVWLAEKKAEWNAHL